VTDTREIHLHDPQTLYRHWEEGQWNPFDIDLAADREQWRRWTIARWCPSSWAR